MLAWRTNIWTCTPLSRKKGHLSFGKLHHFLRLYFCAPNLRSTCKSVSQNCPDCIACRTVPKLPTYGPKLCDVSNKPYEKVYIDIVDFGSADAHGNRYGLTYMDMLSRYLDAIPLPDKTPKSVVRAIMVLFTRYGIPERIVGDNGSEFRSSLTQSV